MEAIKKNIILFDGICNLCNSSINFIIKHDHKDRFRFASLQSDIGKKLLAERGIDQHTIDSIILIAPQKAYYIKSTAVLQIAKQLSGIYPILSIFLILPEFIRNTIYDMIAKNRYKWFGRKDQCMIPTPKLRSLFIDQ